jgi:hypothetical protein
MQHAASPPETFPPLILQAQARGREPHGYGIANRATCHSERSEESRSGPRKQGEIPRFARNDSGERQRFIARRDESHAKQFFRVLAL